MKNNKKGVTLISLSVYIVVATIVIGTLGFINIHFTSQMNSLVTKVDLSNECVKFYSFFIGDVKNNDRIIEYSSNEIKFLNNIKYEIKKRSEEEYAIYRDSVLISQGLESATFNYNYLENTIRVDLIYKDKGYQHINYQIFKIGRGY